MTKTVVKRNVPKSNEKEEQLEKETDGINHRGLSIKSKAGNQPQKKITPKKRKLTKLAAQEMIQNRIRNKLFLAIVLYIVIGGVAIYWYGVPMPKDLPPEIEFDIMDAFPQDLKKENFPKGLFDETIAIPRGIGQESSKHDDDKAANDTIKITIDKSINARKEPEETVINAAGGFGAEAVELHPEFVPNFQTQIKPKSNGNQRWKKIKILKNNATSSVKIYVMDNFFSEVECNGLMKAHWKHLQNYVNQSPYLCFSGIESLRKHLHENGMKKSAEKISEDDFTIGTLCLNESLSAKIGKKLSWSYSTSFYPGESKFSHEFDRRTYELTGMAPENGGKYQVTSYPEGVGYKGHTDCTVDNVDKRDRFATILIYLQNVEKGGETVFPDLGVKIKPKKGRALLWNNMDENGNCDPYSYHKAAIVNKGKKFIMQRWYYYQNFPTLGMRTPSPKLPKRKEDATRVSCDQYEFGSCRWYDEWTYDHITSYSAMRHNLL